MATKGTSEGDEPRNISVLGLGGFLWFHSSPIWPSSCRPNYGTSFTWVYFAFSIVYTRCTCPQRPLRSKYLRFNKMKAFCTEVIPVRQGPTHLNDAIPLSIAGVISAALGAVAPLGNRKMYLTISMLASEITCIPPTGVWLMPTNSHPNNTLVFL